VSTPAGARRRAVRRPRAAVLGLVVALLGVVGLSAGCSDLQGTSGKAYITGDGQISVWPESERSKPVSLEGDTVDGGDWSLADAAGKPVVVNVWWSSCGPCRTEMPMLQEAAAEFKDTVAFVGINTRDSSAKNGYAFEKSLGVSYPSIYSPDGRALLGLKGLPRSMPATIVLDDQGRMAAAISGSIPSKLTLTQLVQCIVDGQAQGQCKVTGKS